MKDIFQQNTIDEFKQRIDQINADSVAKWGKMNVYQMVKHNIENELMLQRKKTFKRLFIG